MNRPCGVFREPMGLLICGLWVRFPPGSPLIFLVFTTTCGRSHRRPQRESNQIGYFASNGRDLYVTARRRGCNGSGDAIDMLLNKRPLGAARQDDQGDATDAEVLLMTDAPAAGEQQVEARPLSGVQQLAACSTCPGPWTAPCASCERTAFAPGPSACRGQRERAPVETSERRLSATNSRTASICSRVTSTCSITSSMRRSSRFDNGRHRQTSALEHPGAAHLPGNALDGLALRPVKRCHVWNSFAPDCGKRPLPSRGLKRLDISTVGRANQCPA